MYPPKSKIFNFQKLISGTAFCQSWSAIEIKSGRRCFVKVPCSEEGVEGETIKTLLVESYAAQKSIRTTKIITANFKCTENGRLCIAYPFLNMDRYRVLDERSFWRHFPESLYEISLIVDYLHIIKLIHHDLKFANFQLAEDAGNPSIILTDLDFLTVTGRSPRAKIMGSPDHIAPEVLRNETVTTQADNYSIGASIRQYLQWYDRHPDACGHTVRRQELHRLSDWCMNECTAPL